MSDTITITGNVATQPEFKRIPSGVSVTTFRLASTQRRFDRPTGTWIDTGTNWYTVSTFRSLADHAFASLNKGDRVLLTGRLKLLTWENEKGKGMTVEIDADAIGHDLLWGTTRFQKDSAPAGAVESERDASSGEHQSGGQGGWAAPGAGPSATGQTNGWDVVQIPAAAAPLASVSEPATVGAEKPF